MQSHLVCSFLSTPLNPYFTFVISHRQKNEWHNAFWLTSSPSLSTPVRAFHLRNISPLRWSHTEHGLHRARLVTKILFDSDYSQLKAGDVISALADDPRLVFVDDQQLFASSLTRLAATHKLTSSYGEIYTLITFLPIAEAKAAAARKLAKAGGLYLNNSPIRDPFLEVSRTDLLNDRMIVLRAGRDQHLILMLR